MRGHVNGPSQLNLTEMGQLEPELQPLTETPPSPTIDVTQVRNCQWRCDYVSAESHRD